MRWQMLVAAALSLCLAACSDEAVPPLSESSVKGMTQTFSPLDGRADYVGAAVCGQCHQEQLKDWKGSHHDLSMQLATPETVLGNFDDVAFEYAGITSRFTERDKRFFVTTDGPDGALDTFEIRYTFGHYPLQQYLIELPSGRLQAFGIAWDSRPSQAGGQRWFHLYPEQNLKAGDRLHWTGLDQNWNFMCAECHSTDLQKNFDANQQRYDTTWAEINVSCEGCHGPGLAHARWAVIPNASARDADLSKGLVVQYHERRDVSWLPIPSTGNAVRSPALATSIEVDACGRCHGRASRLVGDAIHGRSLLESHRPALLDPDQYWPDGQMLGEVFNWGPFLQSRMHQAGVTCSDCHQPHSLALRAEGNALCTQCHDAARFDQPSHTHHVNGTSGSQCVNCHMPKTTFMLVDDRHDHAFRIPRPDLSQTLGTPNACTGCHEDREASWAAQQLIAWFPNSRHRSEHFAAAFDAANTQQSGHAEALFRVISDVRQPALVRASALRALTPPLNDLQVTQVLAHVNDADPLVRLAVVETLSTLPPSMRAEHLALALSDSVLAIRLEAVAALAGEPEAYLPEALREVFSRVLSEYVASLQFNADRPDALVTLGDLHQRRGEAVDAELAYQKALSRDPNFITAYLHYADSARLNGDEIKADKIIRAGLDHQPEAASLHHALGLSLIRRQRYAEALVHLARAAELSPELPNYSYVYAIALNDSGLLKQALNHLEVSLTRHPEDRDLLRASAIYRFENGDRELAIGLARRLLILSPSDPGAQQLLRWVER